VESWDFAPTASNVLQFCDLFEGEGRRIVVSLLGGAGISGGNGGFGGGGGGLGGGGAVFVRQGATLLITDGAMSGGSAVGGSGADGGGDGMGIGSAIFLAGSATYSVSGGNTVTIADSIGGGTDSQITGGFTKSGAGTLALSAANSFTGGTQINGGTLQANTTGSGNSATSSGPVTINSGAVLAGGATTLATAGQVLPTGANTITVGNGGTITAGTGATATDTPGVLKTTSQTWSTGGTFVWKLNLAGTYGTSYVNSAASSNTSIAGDMDALLMSSLSQSTGSNVSLVGQGTNNLTFGATYRFAIANLVIGTFNLADFNTNANFALAQEVDAGLSSSTNSGVDAELNGGSGEDLILTYTPTPEPTSLLLGGLAVAPLMLARRRRKSAEVDVSKPN